jgi:predicted O-methyltransferase YrrM
MQKLPPRVAAFHARARLLAWRIGDDAPKGALRPDDLAALLTVASGRRNVVELGTSRAWTAVSLALAEDARRVTTYDPAVQPVRERYLDLVPRVRDRITFVDQPGDAGPVPGLRRVELLFVDSSHQRDATIREYQAWHSELTDDAVVVFDDYGNPEFPGVAEAIGALGLDGEAAGFLFIHRRQA